MIKKRIKRDNSNKAFDDFFKRILQEKEIVIEFLKFLVNKPWVKDLDFNSLVNEKETYVSGKNKNTADDIIWKINYKEQEIHIVILLEVKSSNDNRMPFRFLDYMGSYYENNFKSLKKDDKIPPIIPILLYVGNTNWNAKIKFHDLVDIPIKSMKKYIPNFEYIPVIMDNISKKKLKEADSILTRLLALNKSKDEQEFKELAHNLFKIIKLKNIEDQNRYLEYYTSYINLVLKAPITHKKAKSIAKKIMEEEMFFITLDHLFEDDRKALKKIQKEKEKVQKEKEKVQKEKENIQKEKEDIQKEKEDIQKEKEDIQKEKEDILKASITKFLSMNLSVSEIAKTLGVTEKLVKDLKKS